MCIAIAGVDMMIDHNLSMMVGAVDHGKVGLSIEVAQTIEVGSWVSGVGSSHTALTRCPGRQRVQPALGQELTEACLGRP